MRYVAVVLCLLALVGCSHQQPKYDSSYTPAAPPPQVSSMAVIGDSYSAGTDFGGVGKKGWPELVVGRLYADGIGDMTVRNGAVRGAGYVHTNSRGVRFIDEIPEVIEGQERLVVILGSVNDRGTPPEDLAAAVRETFAAVRAAAPNATLLVIGPLWVGGPAPRRILVLRNTVAIEAEKAGLPFVDPIVDGWFVDRPDLIGGDGKHPTDEGHVYLADKITPVIAAQLAPPLTK